MNEATLVVLPIVIFGWAVLSEWFAARNLTGPLVFLVAGFVLANSSWGIASVDVESSTGSCPPMVDLRYEMSLHGVASSDLWAAFGDPDAGTGITTVRRPKDVFRAVVTRLEDLGLGLLRVRLVAGATSDGWS